MATKQIPEEKIRLVCELLRNHGDWSFEKIAMEARVSKATVHRVYHKDKYAPWLDIVKEYDFSARNTNRYRNRRTYTTEQIEAVCSYLDMDYRDHVYFSRKQIADLTGVSMSSVYSIEKGLRWVPIAQEHYFYKQMFGPF